MSQANQSGRRAGDGLVAAAAFLAAAPLIAAGWSPFAIAVVAVGLPTLAFVLAGHAPGRGAAAGCIALTLGSLAVGRPAAGVVPWADLAVLGLLVATAQVGASMADRLAEQAGAASAAAPAGRWVTIVVECEGPSDTAGSSVRQPRSPRRDPERRRRERLTRARRESVAVGV